MLNMYDNLKQKGCEGMSSFNWNRSLQEKWDDMAYMWNEKSKAMWDTGSRSMLLPFFQQYVAKGATILDVGCGDGYGSYLFSKNGYNVCGIDISKQMIQFANDRSRSETLSFVHGDITTLPFSSQYFDSILAINSLEWVEKPLKVIVELKRVLKKDGYACVAILGPTAAPRINSFRRLYDEPAVCNTMMPWEFEMLAKENGFSIVDSKGVYKRGVDESLLLHISNTLKKSLSFMWIYMLKKI